MASFTLKCLKIIRVFTIFLLLFQVSLVSTNQATPSSQLSSEPSNQPSTQPSLQPSSQPTLQPTRNPTQQPTKQPVNGPSSQPSLQPLGQPTSQPSSQPTVHPSRTPSLHPSLQPSRQPSGRPSQPTCQPTQQPSCQPTYQPSSQPSSQPILRPSPKPSRQPTSQPSRQPFQRPSSQPLVQPTAQPSSLPIGQPSSQPSLQPAYQPTSQPSKQPLMRPSCQPSRNPSMQPSLQPTRQPSAPSLQPSSQPTIPTSQPSCEPSSQPRTRPTLSPSSQPIRYPSSHPTRQPSLEPTAQPSARPSVPTRQPTSQPSAQPSQVPTRQPSCQPTMQPNKKPTSQPTRRPFDQPSSQPSRQPSSRPSRIPFSQPTARPSTGPSSLPSGLPSAQPTCEPTNEPSGQPSNEPTSQPTNQPTVTPSNQPSHQPTRQPSAQPQRRPSRRPSSQPSRVPTSQPVLHPTTHPTGQPSRRPTFQSSSQPTRIPTAQPSRIPSTQPHARPTRAPWTQPTGRPSRQPAMQPSSQPSRQPIARPSQQPSLRPSRRPSSQPSRRPISRPTCQPSRQPTNRPSPSPPTFPPQMFTDDEFLFAGPSISTEPSPSQPLPSYPSTAPPVVPSAKPSLKPTRSPSRQLTPIISFNSSIVLVGIDPKDLSASARQAILVATATTMRLPASNLRWIGYTSIPDTRRWLESSRTDGRVQVAEHTGGRKNDRRERRTAVTSVEQITVSGTDIGGRVSVLMYGLQVHLETEAVVPAGASLGAVYHNLTSTLTTAVATGLYGINLQAASIRTGATSQLAMANPTSTSFQTFLIQVPPTPSPTARPSAAPTLRPTTTEISGSDNSWFTAMTTIIITVIIVASVVIFFTVYFILTTYNKLKLAEVDADLEVSTLGNEGVADDAGKSSSDSSTVAGAAQPSRVLAEVITVVKALSKLRITTAGQLLCCMQLPQFHIQEIQRSGNFTADTPVALLLRPVRDILRDHPNVLTMKVREEFGVSISTAGYLLAFFEPLFESGTSLAQVEEMLHRLDIRPPVVEDTDSLSQPHPALLHPLHDVKQMWLRSSRQVRPIEEVDESGEGGRMKVNSAHGDSHSVGKGVRGVKINADRDGVRTETTNEAMDKNVSLKRPNRIDSSANPPSAVVSFRYPERPAVRASPSAKLALGSNDLHILADPDPLSIPSSFTREAPPVGRKELLHSPGGWSSRKLMLTPLQLTSLRSSPSSPSPGSTRQIGGAARSRRGLNSADRQSPGLVNYVQRIADGEFSSSDDES